VVGCSLLHRGQQVLFRQDWLAEKGIKLNDVVSWENARDVALEISDPTKNRFGWNDDQPRR
jgi:hypothetical protein